MPDAPEFDNLVTFPGRRVPHNIEAEMALLGSVIAYDRKTFSRVADYLRPEHFALAEHRRIYEALAGMIERGELVTLVSVRIAFENSRALDAVGGPDYLSQLVDCAVTSINGGEYGRMIHEMALRREQIDLGVQVVDASHSEADGEDVDAAIARLIEVRAELAGSGGGACLPIVAPGETALKTCAWLVKGLIPQVGLTFVYGPSGAGKSFVALDIAMAASRGEAWRGRKAKRGAVLYLSPDGGAMFENRIIAYEKHHGLAHGDHQVFSVTCGIDLLAAGSVETVQRTIASIERAHQTNVTAVIVDTASRAMPGCDENAAKDMTRLVESLNRIGDGKRAVIAVHHSGKDLGQGMRGHSALYAAADAVIRVNDGAIDIVKSRDGAGGMVGGFKLDPVEIGIDEDGEPVTSCVVVEADGTGRVPRDGNARMNSSHVIALRTISNLVAAHGEPLPCGGGFPSAQHHGVKARLVHTDLRGSLFEGLDDQAARKRWERCRDWLHAKGFIGVCNGWVWIPKSTATHRGSWDGWDGQPVPWDASQGVPRDGTGRGVYHPVPTRPAPVPTDDDQPTTEDYLQ